MTPSANGFRTKAGMQSQSDLQWSKILSSFPRSCVGMPTDPEQRAEATIKLDPRHSCARRNPVKPTLDSCFRRNDEVCSATPSFAGMTRECRNDEISSFPRSCVGMHTQPPFDTNLQQPLLPRVISGLENTVPMHSLIDITWFQGIVMNVINLPHASLPRLE